MIADEVKLDRKRSYGTVYGEPTIGFVQDGKNFRHDGTPCPEAPPKSELAKAAAVPAPAASSFPTAAEVVTQPQPLTHSEKMKQVWAARRASQAETTTG